MQGLYQNYPKLSTQKMLHAKMKLRQVLQLFGQRSLRCLCFLEPGFNSRLRILATASLRPVTTRKAMQSHAKPCKAMQSLRGRCMSCIRFPLKDFEYMHGIFNMFNTSHSHECSPCRFPSALGASTSLLDVWHELKVSSEVLSLELC